MKTILNVIIFLSITQVNFSFSRIGCMDNSERLQKSGDSKQYHYVSCNCPCQRYPQIADRGRCSKCGHFHDIAPYIIVSHRDAQPSQE